MRFFCLEATYLASLERLQEPIALLTNALGAGFVRARARLPRLDVFIGERRGVELSVGAELVGDVARARGDATRLRGARFRLRQVLVRGVQRSFRQGRASRGLIQRVLGLGGVRRRRRGLALGALRRETLRGDVFQRVCRAQAHLDGEAHLAEPRARRRAEPREPADAVLGVVFVLGGVRREGRVFHGQKRGKRVFVSVRSVPSLERVGVAGDANGVFPRAASGGFLGGKRGAVRLRARHRRPGLAVVERGVRLASARDDRKRARAAEVRRRRRRCV